MSIQEVIQFIYFLSLDYIVKSDQLCQHRLFDRRGRTGQMDFFFLLKFLKLLEVFEYDKVIDNMILLTVSLKST